MMSENKNLFVQIRIDRSIREKGLVIIEVPPPRTDLEDDDLKDYIMEKVRERKTVITTSDWDLAMDAILNSCTVEKVYVVKPSGELDMDHPIEFDGTGTL